MHVSTLILLGAMVSATHGQMTSMDGQLKVSKEALRRLMSFIGRTRKPAEPRQPTITVTQPPADDTEVAMPQTPPTTFPPPIDVFGPGLPHGNNMNTEPTITIDDILATTVPLPTDNEVTVTVSPTISQAPPMVKPHPPQRQPPIRVDQLRIGPMIPEWVVARIQNSILTELRRTVLGELVRRGCLRNKYRMAPNMAPRMTPRMVWRRPRVRPVFRMYRGD